MRISLERAGGLPQNHWRYVCALRLRQPIAYSVAWDARRQTSEVRPAPAPAASISSSLKLVLVPEMQEQPGLSASLRLRLKLPEVPLEILLEAGEIKQYLIVMPQ